MAQSSLTKADGNVLKDLLDLIGRENLEEQVEPKEIEEILQAGVPRALKTQLDLMIGAESERARMWTSNQWLDRAGYSAVQKIAVKKQISFDQKTLEALRAIALEDTDGTREIEQEAKIHEALEEGKPAEGENTCTQTLLEEQRCPSSEGESSAQREDSKASE